MTMVIKKIISGGQTGADRGGLEAAVECKLLVGGTAPYQFKTEEGNDYTLREFGLDECAVSSYTHRTQMNVKDSDGTVIFMPVNSSGSLATERYCKEFKKPCIINPKTPSDLAEWIATHGISTLNVAGNRESKCPGLKEKVKNFMIETINIMKQ